MRNDWYKQIELPKEVVLTSKANGAVLALGEEVGRTVVSETFSTTYIANGYYMLTHDHRVLFIYQAFNIKGSRIKFEDVTEDFYVGERGEPAFHGITHAIADQIASAGTCGFGYIRFGDIVIEQNVRGEKAYRIRVGIPNETVAEDIYIWDVGTIHVSPISLEQPEFDYLAAYRKLIEYWID